MITRNSLLLVEVFPLPCLSNAMLKSKHMRTAGRESDGHCICKGKAVCVSLQRNKSYRWTNSGKPILFQERILNLQIKTVLRPCEEWRFLCAYCTPHHHSRSQSGQLKILFSTSAFTIETHRSRVYVYIPTLCRRPSFNSPDEAELDCFLL